MKPSKSQKNITIITDRKAQHDLLTGKPHESLTKRSGSCRNLTHKSPCSKMPISCKNIESIGETNYAKEIESSGQKHRRQRSSSLQNKQESGINPQNRKKQLDNLCFQRIVNQLKKFIFQRQQIWDLECLCYGQLIKLLWICRFVTYPHQQQYILNNEQGELKKIYLLWLSISYKKMVSYRDFISFVQIIENINVDEQKIQASIMNLQSEINETCTKKYENFQQDPNYTFFMKKLEVHRKDKYIIIDEQTKQRLFSDFKAFKFSKLKDSGMYEYVKATEQQIVVSKKSSQLADQRRKKIQNKIRQTKPHVENINLLDILTFRQRDHNQQNKKVLVAPQKKKSIPVARRGELKKQIELLSRPKVHFEQRKQDEINYEKEEQQFTFHPKIHLYKLGSKQKIMQVKNVDKVLVRMKQARKIKEQKQNIIQKGWNNNMKIQGNYMKNSVKIRNSYQQNGSENKQNMINSEKQDLKAENYRKSQTQKPNNKVSKYEVSKDYLKIPLLYIDVNIEEGKKERIIIYDNDKASDLAKEFGEKHKLTEETISRLETLLQQQMDTVLARIEEESDDECSFAY